MSESLPHPAARVLSTITSAAAAIREVPISCLPSCAGGRQDGAPAR